MFRHNKKPIWFYLLVTLAAIGLISQLLTNTTTFFTTILTIIGSAVLIYGVIYFLFFRSKNTTELKKYKKAVKQSKNRKKQFTAINQVKGKKNNLSKKTRDHKHAPHLRVIDGKKGKRKDRATF
ncbi:SA1362 family protein [Paraliobacillus salinarum]|uniref:SA1362 family protein n=1 Tax=Paraliobacillus salinarum TaxID=1158996 RepID=UPI0015F72C2B|nr:SA1362 family protein [Paraliobacillus salinarum]